MKNKNLKNCEVCKNERDIIYFDGDKLHILCKNCYEEFVK